MVFGVTLLLAILSCAQKKRLSLKLAGQPQLLSLNGLGADNIDDMRYGSNLA